MKISNLDNKIATLPPVSERKSAPGAGTSAQPQASATVDISSAAQLAALGNEGNFDAAKVERVSQAIRDGSFKVNADTIADKLIQNAREQLSKTYR